MSLYRDLARATMHSGTSVVRPDKLTCERIVSRRGLEVRLRLGLGARFGRDPGEKREVQTKRLLGLKSGINYDHDYASIVGEQHTSWC